MLMVVVMHSFIHINFKFILFIILFPSYCLGAELDDLIYSDFVVSELYYAANNTHTNTLQNTPGHSAKNISVNYKNNLKSNVKINWRIASWAHSQLLEHYIPTNNEPAYFKSDLKKIAAYYSQFPDAIYLIASIKDKPWQVSYAEKRSTTRAIGSSLDVKKADVFIDTRAAMQAKKGRKCIGRRVCISSPADILLHELLHVSLMLNGRQFILDGGMQKFMYPYIHEQRVIKLESELYKRMSAIDKIKRPYRNQHQGKYIFSSCALCIK